MTTYRETPILTNLVRARARTDVHPHLRLTTAEEMLGTGQVGKVQYLGIVLGRGAYDTERGHPMIRGARAVTVRQHWLRREDTIRIEMPDNIPQLPNERVLRMLAHLTDAYEAPGWAFDQMDETTYLAARLPRRMIYVEAQRGDETSAHRVPSTALIAAGARLAVAETLAPAWHAPLPATP